MVVLWNLDLGTQLSLKVLDQQSTGLLDLGLGSLDHDSQVTILRLAEFDFRLCLLSNVLALLMFLVAGVSKLLSLVGTFLRRQN